MKKDRDYEKLTFKDAFHISLVFIFFTFPIWGYILARLICLWLFGF